MHRRYAESRNVDDDDYAVTTNGTCSGAATGDCRRLDANADGVVDSADQTVIAAYIATLDSDTELQRVPAATHSRRGNLFAHQGLVLDPEIESYQNRARQYAPAATRYMQFDRLAHVDKMTEVLEPGWTRYGTAMVELVGSAPPFPLRRFHDSIGLNLYGYMSTHPLNQVDPSGMCPPSPACLAGPCGTGIPDGEAHYPFRQLPAPAAHRTACTHDRRR